MLESLEPKEIALRFFLALLAGLLLGLDRDIKNKPVDFRAYMIVSVTASLVAMVSLRLTQIMPLEQPGLGMDPTRIIQSVLLGVAFIGAATIIKNGRHVIGTATGATVWASGGIGLTFGFGFYELGLIAFACIFLTLVCLGLLLPRDKDD